MRKLIILMITMLFIVSYPLNAKEPAESLETLEETVSEAIVELIKERPNHRLLKYPEKRLEMVRALLKASEITNTPWQESIVIARYETSFYQETIGAMGERGVMQVMPGSNVRYCAEQLGRKVNLNNLEDQFICGNYVLNYSIDKCDQDLKKGLSFYATGHVCEPQTKGRLAWLVRRRYKKILKLKNL